jgi:hypothetical protein
MRGVEEPVTFWSSVKHNEIPRVTNIYKTVIPSADTSGQALSAGEICPLEESLAWSRRIPKILAVPYGVREFSKRTP